jgi:hypothetical protein
VSQQRLAKNARQMGQVLRSITMLRPLFIYNNLAENPEYELRINFRVRLRDVHVSGMLEEDHRGV